MGASAFNLEVILATILIFFLTTGGSAVIILFLKKYLGAVEMQVKKINGSIASVTQKHDDCRNELPKRFTDSAEFKEYRKRVDDLVGKLFDRLDEVCEGVAFLRGSLDISGTIGGKKGGDEGD